MFARLIVVVCGVLSGFSMLCTWLGSLLDSASWMRFGGGLLVLLAVILPVDLVMAVVGLIRGGRGKRWSYVLDFLLMPAVFIAAVVVHVGLTGGV